MKNYTSKVPASRSVSYIEHFLVKGGARNISKTYDDNEELEAMYFQKEVAGKILAFKLPANVTACYKALLKQVSRPVPATYKRIKEQASRTDWKILSDWVEIQMALIELEQAEFEQIFLPYWFDGEKTLFDQIQSGGFKLLGNGSTLHRTSKKG